jgi:uncharacterized protein (DUF1684 family)
MKLVVTSLFVLALFSAVSGQTFYGSTDVKTFREGRDHEFRDKEESPLKEEDFDSFKGLNYFPVDEAFRVTATFKRTPEEKYFQMPTSSGKTKKFVKYGTLKFKMNGAERTLSVYQIDKEVLDKFPEYADLLFIPFRDVTNKTETYSGGRYIDIKQSKGDTVVLDFNLAYNPSCAYGSDRFNCPIPPRENTLDVAIKAGEKRYEYSGKSQ